MRKNRREAGIVENYRVLLLVGVAEDEESAGLRHGNGLLLQLDVG